MTTERRDRVIFFYCDLCGDELETGETEFNDAIHAKKAEGWGSRRDERGEWMDICDTCKVPA